MFFAGSKQTIAIILIAMTTVTSFHWHDEYSKMKAENPDLGFFDYLSDDLSDLGDKINEGLKKFPGLLKQANEGKDNIKIGSINKITEALEIYYMDNREYPEKIEELLGDYLTTGNKLIKDPTFYYTSRFGSGYKIGIELDNGEIYEVKK